MGEHTQSEGLGGASLCPAPCLSVTAIVRPRLCTCVPLTYLPSCAPSFGRDGSWEPTLPPAPRHGPERTVHLGLVRTAARTPAAWSHSQGHGLQPQLPRSEHLSGTGRWRHRSVHSTQVPRLQARGPDFPEGSRPILGAGGLPGLEEAAC